MKLLVNTTKNEQGNNNSMMKIDWSLILLENQMIVLGTSWKVLVEER